MKITQVETIALHDPGKASETLVRVHTDEGVSGIGQVDAPSLVVEGIIRCEGGLEQIIRGQDPVDTASLWQKMHLLTSVFGRRGVTMGVIGAVESALWDIAGKTLEQPLFRLLARSWCPSQGYAAMSTASQIEVYAECKTRVSPYATIYPPGSTPGQLAERFRRAIALGFQGVKLEAWPGTFGHGSAAADVATVRHVRECIGKERRLMVDMCGHWQHVRQAVETIRAIEPYDIYFVEAPLPADHLDAYARLADAVDVPIAAGDWGFSTRYDFEELVRRGRVDVLQPSAVRVGGVAELARIAEYTLHQGLLCIPHAWCHMVGVAVEAHLAAVFPNMPTFEYPLAYPDSPLISDLLDPPLRPDADGLLPVPTAPGLGVTLNEKVVERFRVQPY